MTTITGMSNGGVGRRGSTGAGKISFNNIMDELHGDNSLEPGEVITPPHGNTAVILKDNSIMDTMNTKRLLKETICKGIKKSSQIDKNIEPKDTVRAGAASSVSKVGGADYAVKNFKETKLKDSGVMDDDSEGLYSGSDSSCDHQKINRLTPYEMHPKSSTLSLSQSSADNFVNGPPFKNFMPRLPHFMPRGNMRPNFYRPPFIHGHPRPYGPPIGGPPRHNMPRQHHTPPPSRGHSPIRAPKSNGGRQTPPPGSSSRSQRLVSDSVNSRHIASKEKQLWTHCSKPSISWSLGAKQKKRIEDLYRDYNEALSKKKIKSDVTANAKRIEKSKTERRNLTKSTEKIENKLQDKSKNESKKKEDKKIEKSLEEKSPQDTNDEMLDIFAHSPPSLTVSNADTDGRSKHIKSESKQVKSESKQIKSESKQIKSESKQTKSESRQIKGESKHIMINPLKIKKEKLDPPVNKPNNNQIENQSKAAAPIMHKHDKQSHTPPPPPSAVSKPDENSLSTQSPPSVPIDSSQEKMKRETTINVHNRIGKLLEDDDLHFQIEELLANKDKFLRKTRDYKNRENLLKDHKLIKHSNKLGRYTPEIDMKHLEGGVRIKTEPPDTDTNDISSYSLIDKVVPIREIKRETSPWEDEYEHCNIRTPSPLPIHTKQSHSTTTSMKRSSMSTVATSSSPPPPPPPKNNTALKKHENPFKQTLIHDDDNVGHMPKSNEREHDRRDRLSEQIHFKPKSGCSIKLEFEGHDSKKQDSNCSKSKNSQMPPHSSTIVKTFKPLSYPVDDVESNWDSSSKSTNGSKTSPDTDDYNDNWENDDSTIPCDATTATIFNASEDDDSIISNHLWNANSTPPPKTATTKTIKSTTPISTPPKKDDKKIDIDMQIMYDKFLKSIKMNTSESEDNNDDATIIDETSNIAHPNSGSSETSDSSTETSGDEGESSSQEEQGEDNVVKPALFERAAQTESIEQNVDETLMKPLENDIQTKNSVSRDLKRLKTLEGNLARIQMMRENYDSGDELCEELVKMESLFLVEKNAIMEKYKKHDLKLNANRKQQVTLEQMEEKMTNCIPKPDIIHNKIFDVNREAIKLTISPNKLKRKAAIFEKDDTELNVSPTEKDAIERLAKPPKEIAIVKPIMDTKRFKRLSSPLPLYKSRSRRSNSRSRRSRSISRSRGNSLSPRRRRPTSPGRSRNRFRSGGVVGKRSRSRSYSPKRSVSRSRSRSRSRHITSRHKRHSYSPLPPSKSGGPRSPPLSAYRRSYSRERYSRSPLPFKPPSPPMRRSYSASLSPNARSTSPAYESFSTYYSSDREDSSNYYYDISPNDAPMPLSQRIDVIDSSQTNEQSNDGMYGSTYDTIATSSPYTDMTSYGSDYDNYYLSHYNSHFYSSPSNVSMQGENDLQHEMGYYYNEYGQPLVIEGMGANPSLLKELPKAPAVAVQKGNVLEIVPSGDITPIIAPAPEVTAPVVVAEETEEEKAAKLEAKKKRKEARLQKKIERKKTASLALAEESGQPIKKKVNFEDQVAVNQGSDAEDDKVIRRKLKHVLKKSQVRAESPDTRRARLIAREFGKLPLPPPPPVTATTTRVQLTYLLKKPTMRYYHWDPDADVIYSSYNRMPKPPRNRKSVSVPYKLVAGSDKNDDITKKTINSKYLQPPPPLGQPLTNEMEEDVEPLEISTTVLPINSSNFLRAPPPIPSIKQSQSPPQPIPVLGQDYTNISVVAPPGNTQPTLVYPVHIQTQIEAQPQLTYISTSKAPKGLLPTPSIQPVFNVTPVRTITEIKREESPIPPEYELHTPMYSSDTSMVDTIKTEETDGINNDDAKSIKPTPMISPTIESIKTLPSDLSEIKYNDSLNFPVSLVET